VKENLNCTPKLSGVSRPLPQRKKKASNQSKGARGRTQERALGGKTAGTAHPVPRSFLKKKVDRRQMQRTGDAKGDRKSRGHIRLAFQESAQRTGIDELISRKEESLKIGKKETECAADRRLKETTGYSGGGNGPDELKGNLG